MPTGAASAASGKAMTATAGPASTVRRVIAIEALPPPTVAPLSGGPAPQRKPPCGSRHAERRLVDLEQLLLLGTVVRLHPAQLEHLAQGLDVEPFALGLGEHVLDLVPGIALLLLE